MYCPQCATENLDNASFCRGCGSNISLVSQALTGNLPAASPAEELEEDSSYGRQFRRKGNKPPSVEKGIKNIFMGFAFIFTALCVKFFMPGGFAWWYWMLFPAFTMLGGGISELVRLRMERGSALPAAPRRAMMPVNQARPVALPGRNTSELMPQPPSVTEATTRHLGGEMPTKHLETPVETRPKNN